MYICSVARVLSQNTSPYPGGTSIGLAACANPAWRHLTWSLCLTPYPLGGACIIYPWSLVRVWPLQVAKRNPVICLKMSRENARQWTVPHPKSRLILLLLWRRVHFCVSTATRNSYSSIPNVIYIEEVTERVATVTAPQVYKLQKSAAPFSQCLSAVTYILSPWD